MSMGDIHKLKEAGYSVVQRNPWHFQIIGKKATVNIWPTKNKYMIEYGSGASIYTDVVAAVASIIGDPKTLLVKRETIRERIAKEVALMYPPETQRLYQMWKDGITSFMQTI